METLLAFPTTSRAFSAIKPLSRDDVRGSPPRKTARLDGDVDSSSKGKGKQGLQDAGRHWGVRKLNVHNRVSTPGLPLTEDSTYTNTIRYALQGLLDREGPIPLLPSSYKLVFDAVEVAVALTGKGAEVYAMLGRELDRACAEGISKRLLKGKGIPWLQHLVGEWKWFNGRVNLLRTLLTWLDRGYVSDRGLLAVRALGFKAFEKHVISGNVAIHDKVSPCIEEWVNAEREAQGTTSPHRLHVLTLIEMLQTLDLYQSDFHTPYVLATQVFYSAEATALSSEGKLDPKEFVSHCITRVVQEVKRCREVLPEESLASVEQAAEKALMNGHITWLVQDGVAPLVDAKDVEGLRKMYDLLDRIDALEPLKLAFAKSVETTVSKIVLLIVEEEEMIPQLLAFKSFIDSLLTEAFREDAKVQYDDSVPVKEETAKGKQKGHQSCSQEPQPSQKKRGKGPFGYAATDAFAKGFGKRQRKPAEMIAKFIDKAMRKGQKGRPDEEFEEKLNAVLALYQFTRDRDVFRTFYWRALAKRLLLQKSASDDFEKAVIKKLRDGYDPEFGKGDDMFKDLALSKDLLFEYHERQADDKLLSVMVLQYSCWPYQPPKGREIDLPPSMLGALERYSKFYQAKHKPRKLDWFHSLGTATLTAIFAKGEKELSVSLYQAIILLLFNDVVKMGYKEIKQQTSMGDEDLRRTLQSLACGKKRVLKKIPPGKDVDDDDQFVYNVDFTDPNRRVHINSIQQKETVGESKATDDKIQEDRGYLLDAAIVRIMKGRKRLTNQLLITETVVAVKGHFQPDVRQIKKQIDSLTDREYIRRDDDNRDMYHYVA